MLKGKVTWRDFELHVEGIRKATAIDINETPKEKDIRIARLLRDYDAFVQFYFPHYTADEITSQPTGCADFQIDLANQVLKNPNIFAVAEWPREHAKSVHANIFIPIWLKLNGELSGMVVVGKTEDDAIRQISALQAELQDNQRLINDWGKQQTAGSWEHGEFATQDGCFFKALGRGQSPRGLRERQRRPNYLVIDDIDDDTMVNNPARVSKAVRWVFSALFGAISIKRSRVIVAGNRIHRKSILAHIVGDIDPQTPKRKGIYHSKVFALIQKGKRKGLPAWPEKYSLAELMRKFLIMGGIHSPEVQTEYFHNPIIEGKIFKREHIQWKKFPPLHEYDALVMYCDPSFSAKATSDFKAIKLWGKKGKELHKIKAFVRQCSVSLMVKWWYDFYESVPENAVIEYYIEGKFAQDRLLGDFELEGELRGYQLPIRGDYRDKPEKLSRIASMQPYYERLMIWYNLDEQHTEDMQTSIDHLIAIEPGYNSPDDSPDADEGAIFKLTHGSFATPGSIKVGARSYINRSY